MRKRASSSSSPSGTGQMEVPAKGSRQYSACVPSMSAEDPVDSSDGLAVRVVTDPAEAAFTAGGDGGMMTRSSTLNSVTASPTSVTGGPLHGRGSGCRLLR